MPASGHSRRRGPPPCSNRHRRKAVRESLSESDTPEVPPSGNDRKRPILDARAGEPGSQERPFVERGVSRFSISDLPFSGKSNREQIMGKRLPRMDLRAIT